MSFEDYGLQTQLRDLWQEKKSGTLSCDVDGFEKQLFVKAGSICFATSNDPDDKLHMVLISQGRFSEEQFAEAEPNFNEDISVGRNLVEMGLISQQELVEGAKGQVYTVFRSLICAANGTFEFKEDLPDGIVSLPLNLPADFIRAILTINDKEWVANQFGSLDFIPTINPEKPLNFDDLAAVDFGADIFGLLDGETSYSSLAFEADVDEFTLQKFLYAMQFLGYITVESDDAADDEAEAEAVPEPEVEDVRDDLSEALAQSEELEGLKNVSMDETIDLPAMKGLTDDGEIAMGSLDATMEISKDALKMDDGADINAINPESTAEIEAAAAFEAMEDDEDDDEEDEDDVGLDDAMGMDTMGAFEPDEEEQGLDDLGAMSDAALMGDMDDTGEEAPSSVPDDVIMPDDEPDDAEEDEAKPGRFAALLNSRLIPLAAVGLILIGGLYMGRPYLEKHLNPLAPADEMKIDDEIAELTPPTDQEPATDAEQPAEAIVEPNQKVEPEPTESEATATVDQTEAKDTAPAETLTTDESPPQQVVENNPEPTKQTAPAAESKPQEPIAANQEPADLESAKLDPVTGLPVEQSLGGDANYSPVAEGWNSSSGIAPNGHRQAEVMLPKSPLREGSLVARNTPKNILPKEPNIKKPAPKEPATKQADDDTRVVQLKEIQSDPAPNVEKATTKTPASKPTTSKDIDDSRARQALSAGNYEQAARAFRQAYEAMGDQKTVMAYMVCNRDNVEKAYVDAKGDPRFFVLPRGKCFWVCWGRFDSRLEALAAKDALPSEMVNKQDNDIRLLRELF